MRKPTSLSAASWWTTHAAAARALALLVVVAALGICGAACGWGDYLVGAEGIARLDELVAENLPAALAVYGASVVVAGTLLAVPGLLFALAAGVLFGPWLGTAACVVASTLGAVLAFLMGRTFLKDAVKPMAMRNTYLRRWLFDTSSHGMVALLAVTRLVPLFPYNLQNFAYGVTDVPLWLYALCTFAFIIPGTALYTFAAAGAVDEVNRAVYLGVTAFLAVAVVGVSWALKRRYLDG